MSPINTGPAWSEADRLAALARYAILDTPPEAVYDNVARMAAQMLNVPLAAVSLVSEGRQWFKAEYGLGMRETPVCDSICAVAILQQGTFVVPDTIKDPRFACNPLVTGAPHIRFYAGELLVTPDGYPLGALCVLDREPRPQGLTSEQKFLLRALAQQVMGQLELKRALLEQKAMLAKQRDIEVQLRAERDRSARLLEGMDEGFLLLDKEFRILQVNSGLLRMEQRAVSELIGRSYWEIWPEPQHLTQSRLYQRALIEQTKLSSEQYRIFPDGRHAWLDIRIIPVEDGLAVFFRDITEKHRAEEALRRSEQRLAAIFNQAFVGMAEADLDGTLLRVNGSFCRMLNRPQHALQGISFTEITHPDDIEKSRHCVRRVVEAGDAFTIEKRYLRQDGSWLWATCNLARIVDAEGKPQGIIAAITDISERKLAEQNLQRLAAELSEADRRKTEFLATLAHELRNPLAPLRNGLELMRLAGDQPGTVTRIRDMMDRQLTHMARLIDDLLDVARITRGKLELKKEIVALQQIISSAVETSMPAIENNRHQLVIEVPDDTVMLEADPTRIAQVISNLLNNAAKYTPSGGCIRLTAVLQQTEVAITVGDTGIGIAAEALPKVFEMFSQVGASPDRTQGGLGIGLTLVRQLVQMHGGSVIADSPGPGKGSSFTVRLPLATVQASVPSLLNRHAEKENASSTCSLRIIVADDNVDAAQSLADFLRMKGYVTGISHNGSQTLELADKFAPDLLFLDIGMPGMDGYQVARAVRARPGMENIVLIALTGWGAENDRIRSKHAGFDYHFTKPADLTVIEDLLRQLAQQRERTLS